MKINPFDKLRVNAEQSRSIQNLKFKIIFFIILIFGAFFRFYGLNWDQNMHLHPDERFLTMVGNAMKTPSSSGEYLDPQTSTFNPANLNYKFFVYGTFPLILNKLLALYSGNDSYNSFTLQGRFLSGLFDLFILILIFKTVKLLEEKYKLSSSIKYFASFFYAISVLPIQLSHFFAVDTFLNFFMFASFYCVLKYSLSNRHSGKGGTSASRIIPLILSAIFFGLAISSKITAFFILPLNFFFLFPFISINIRELKKVKIKQFIVVPIFLCALYIITSYITIRLADPYLFESPNFLNPAINSQFKESITALKSFEGKDVWYPPGVQWIHKMPILFPLENIAFFGLGIPLFLLTAVGIFFVIMKLRRIELVIIALWTISIFIFQSVQFAKSMRYFIALYPFFAICAAIGVYHLARKWKNDLKIVLFALVLLWPLSFFSIYTQKQSRVQASEWIYKNVPNQSFILSEHWDDPLPLLIPQSFEKTFIGEQLPIFDPDTKEKWDKMNRLLQKADYYILSSNRGWGSIPTASEKYPLMSKFYSDLFHGKLQYKRIKEFTSYPSLHYLGLPFEIPDQWSEEAFTVYDHPEVVIFKNKKK